MGDSCLRGETSSTVDNFIQKQQKLNTSSVLIRLCLYWCDNFNGNCIRNLRKEWKIAFSCHQYQIQMKCVVVIHIKRSGYRAEIFSFTSQSDARIMLYFLLKIHFGTLGETFDLERLSILPFPYVQNLASYGISIALGYNCLLERHFKWLHCI